MSRLSDCDNDIRNLKKYADELERTLGAVNRYAANKNWRGPAGERFRKEWAARSKEIREALQHAKDEMTRIRAKVAKEEADKEKDKGGD
ncbi:hypothetical protein [Streptomyces sp. XD-27]|uniref:hypothetical protein n=1 Tax=Streptomyces sp. XD-27 TaxID=3062779 RepID=UPI0026F420E2|nr:hypothetical protein [Streptomyces sp. XD-27]WKX70973.1 hypothetical protein Q3Y56_14595 [Streptomyces sp. XD-27]